MLPIHRTLSASARVPRAGQRRRVHVVSPSEPTDERLKDQRSPGGRRSPLTLEGELYKDDNAVAAYLCAAGESAEVRSGELLSVYA